MRLIIIIAALAVATASCSSTKKSAGNKNSTGSSDISSLLGSWKGFPPATPKPTDDGLSIENAIVIMDTTEGPGVKAEYAWIKKHYSDYDVKSQALRMTATKAYDVITIVFTNKKELELYFDISNFYGKF